MTVEMLRRLQGEAYELMGRENRRLYGIVEDEGETVGVEWGTAEERGVKERADGPTVDGLTLTCRTIRLTQVVE